MGEPSKQAVQGFHPELSSARRWAILVCCVLAAGFSIMSQLTMTTCLPAIIAEFGVDTAQGQWLTTSYMLASGIMIPCTGFLMARFESRKLFLAANAVFLVGLLGAVVPNFYALVAVRCIQGFAAGIFIPLMQVVAFRLFEPQRRGFAMGVSAVALAAGPVLGPIVAGVCTDLWGWRSVFLCVAVLTLVSIATYPVVAALRDKTERPPFDMASVALVAVGFAGVVIGTSNAGAPGALAACVLPLVTGIAALALFARRQTRLEQPFLNLRPFANRDFTVGVLACMVVFGALINTETFISIYVQNDQGFLPTDAALVLLPGSIAAATLAPFTGRVLDRKGPLGLAVAGFALLTASGVCSTFVDSNSPLWFSLAVFVVRCAGNACVMQNMQTWAVNRLPASQMTHGTAIANTLRQVGGALVNTLLFALMGLAAPTAGELGGIKLAFGVSCVLVAAIGAVVLARLYAQRRAS